MSARHDRELDDALLDEALRALAGAQDPALDLRPRVMAAIEADARPRGARAGLGMGSFAWPAVPRLAFAIGMIAIAAVAAALWMVTRSGPESALVGDGSESPAASRPAGGAPPDAARLAVEQQAPAVENAGFQHPRRSAARQPVSDLPPPVPALPPLEEPEPIVIEDLDRPPLAVARLEIERLSFEPLEVEPLDALAKE